MNSKIQTRNGRLQRKLEKDSAATVRFEKGDSYNKNHVRT